jgi:hypothetical protein
VSGHREKRNEGECIGHKMYPYMKNEEWKLLNCSKKGEGQEEEW